MLHSVTTAKGHDMQLPFCLRVAPWKDLESVYTARDQKSLH